jgi:hypothetical protein
MRTGYEMKMESWNSKKILKICAATNVQIPNSNALPMANVQSPMALELPQSRNTAGAVVVSDGDIEAGRGEAPNKDL